MSNPTFKIQATNYADVTLTVVEGGNINKMAELFRNWRKDRAYTSTLRKLELIQVHAVAEWSVPTIKESSHGEPDTD